MSTKRLLEMGLMFSALATMGDEAIYSERGKAYERGRTKFDLPNNPVKPTPAGAKVWTEYGNVTAINEANAIRKYNNQKSK